MLSGYINATVCKQAPPASTKRSDVLGLFIGKMGKTLGNVWKRSSKDAPTHLHDVL